MASTSTSTALPLHRRHLLRHGLGALLLPTALSPLLAACGGDDEDDVATTTPVVAATPRLATADNFRDVGGADDASAYRTSSGRKVRRGVLYRCNALAVSAADLATLTSLGIKAVYDLRTPAEIAQKADVLPTGATYLNINVSGTSSADLPAMTSAADAIAMMEYAERMMVTDAGMRARYAQLVTALADGTGAQLFHCTAGKDRTGWSAAIVLSLLDVPRATIIQDYLLTNTCSAASIEASYQGMVKAYGQAYADILKPLLGVQESFLVAGLDQATASYGSMAGYITNGLGIPAATQEKLRARLIA